MKARMGPLGDNVLEALYHQARMEGLGSAPLAMEDKRALEVTSLALSQAQSVSEAELAYLRDWLNSEHPTYVHPPREFLAR